MFLITRDTKISLRLVCKSESGRFAEDARRLVSRLVRQPLLQETGLLVLETLKRDPLEVEDPPSGTYVKILPVASSMEPMELGQTDSTTVVNREARDTLDHTCDRLST